MPRLRRSDSSRPGITRRRSGRGFSYRDAAGQPVSAPLRERIAALAIPPAWTDVWISPHANGHVLAFGVDDAGRRQAIYHPAWREQKDRVKFERALDLAETLPSARGQVTRDLHLPDPTRERALAVAFRMLDQGSLRVGSERYADAHGSFGLSTLLCAHVDVRDDRVIELKFPAKSGKEWESDIVDADLAAVVRTMARRSPTARLIAYRDGRQWHPLSAEAINDYVRERTGGDFTAKDFRTLHGTSAAALSLARHGAPTTATDRKRAIAQAMRDAAEVLSNTPSIARASYVDPRVVDLYDADTTVDPARPASIEAELRALLRP